MRRHFINTPHRRVRPQAGRPDASADRLTDRDRDNGNGPGPRRPPPSDRRAVLLEWVAHYNQGRPHASLGPGIPDVPVDRLARPTGHQIPDGHGVIAAPILAGLHHEYRLERLAA